jgi:hypothetical protein
MIEFTEKGEVVCAALEEEGEFSWLLRLPVRDAGIGIAEDKSGSEFRQFNHFDGRAYEFVYSKSDPPLFMG